MKTLTAETDYRLDYVMSLAHRTHDVHDLGAPVSSGSFKADAMAVVPCSMKSLAAMAHGFSDNLLLRAADVTLKEGRRLVIAPRETPLSVIHLENLLKLARLGVAVMPPVPAFYHRPDTVAELVDQFCRRVLGRMGVADSGVRPWGE